MQKQDRREFLKKLMLGTSAVGAMAVGAKALEVKEDEHSKQVLYKRNKTWEFYYKQAK
ncbi:twin-arginine translocation signal domain-containing protein [Campylobacter mucosalis]|uniref:Putative formate dehydrogenase-associated protein n=1 Tax=Campylobacter mucosalis CCUG 21559 TaxID=1032067 RepID=A0A6G5QFA6_9BACT|nr:twin-arginine translocation signal domain-containing protein [Campylobacter mucosalis]QCD44186.1 putative formate dehydrogenase-associated protein [Campylobacter mucosalis CCUG 21559]QKF63611.1 putative formate dehydrogenase-associated protein [Campylobacter mucosalis]